MEQHRQTVLVLGGTGTQGGSVVDALLKDPKHFHVRVLTRDPKSKNAVALQQRGVEVVKGNNKGNFFNSNKKVERKKLSKNSEKKSRNSFRQPPLWKFLDPFLTYLLLKGDFDNEEELLAALKGVDLAYLLTNFWQPPFTKEAELDQGRKFVDAARKLGTLKVIIFSTLPYAEKITNGKIKVAHIDSKGEIEKYLKDSKLPFVNVGTSIYMQNFEASLSPLSKLEGTNEYILNYPMKPEDRAPLTDLKNYGEVVAAVFKNYKEYLGKTYIVTSEMIEVQKVAQTIQEITGFKVHLSDLTPEKYAQLPIPHASEMAEMYRFFSESPVSFDNDIEEHRKLIGKLTTWKEFVEKSWKDWAIFGQK